MSVIIRQVSSKRRFDKPRPSDNWIKRGEVPADAVTDLKTTFNKLSIFEVENQEESVNRVITALAANRNSIQKFDYILLEKRKFMDVQRQYGFNVKETLGKTPDEQVNDWHQNLVELTDQRIVEFAKALVYNGKKYRKPKKEINRMVREGILNGFIERKLMSQRLLSKLGVDNTLS